MPTRLLSNACPFLYGGYLRISQGGSTIVSAIWDSSAGKLALLTWLLPYIVPAHGLEGIARYVVAYGCAGYRA